MRRGRSASPAALFILACVAVIAVTVHLSAGPNLEPVAYLFIALSAATLGFTYLITRIRNEIRAALCMLAFWGIAMTSVFMMFYAFG